MAVFKFSNVGGFGTYQRYNDFLAGNPAVIADKGSMYPLGVVTVPSGGQAFVEFTNIPQTYKHLQIRTILRTTRAASADTVYWRVNSDGGSNYTLHSLYGNGTSALPDAAANLTYGYYFNPPAASTTSGIFGTGIVDILDYNNTNKFKTFRTMHGYDANGSGVIFLTSSLWRSTNAITSIRFESQNAANISEFSSFALYGVQA